MIGGWDAMLYLQAPAQACEPDFVVCIPILDCCCAADLSSGALDTESCQLFCHLAMQTPPLGPSRFSALLQDFGNLARGEGTTDVLLAYEL